MRETARLEPRERRANKFPSKMRRISREDFSPEGREREGLGGGKVGKVKYLTLEKGVTGIRETITRGGKKNFWEWIRGRVHNGGKGEDIEKVAN